MQISLFQHKTSDCPLPSSFISITPFDAKESSAIEISYSVQSSQFGELFIASTPRGICHLSFNSSEEEAKQQVEQEFQKATFIHQETDLHQKVMTLFTSKGKGIDSLPLHIKGTSFQFKVWNYLLNIPLGETTHYGHIAKQLNQPTAARAIGTAVGSNKVSFLIPCHRVVQNGGGLGGFRWGIDLKKDLLNWEQNCINK